MSNNYKNLFIKILKFKKNKFIDDLKFLQLAKKKNLSKLAENYFEKKTKLTMIDGYLSKKSKNSIIPWHSDKAYKGEISSERLSEQNFYNPDYIFLKVFIYLTDVSPNNGCMSYIPNTHKILYYVREGIFKKKLRYSPYWSLDQLLDFLKINDNFNYISERLQNSEILETFLENAKKLGDNLSSNYDYDMKAGDAIVFDEGGIHRGSKPVTHDRLVLRYNYCIEN